MTRRGPNTDRGKAAVRLNAVKHGLRSDAPVLPGESFSDWQRHLEGIIESLQPEGHLETVLAEIIASLLWRLRRAQRFEVAAVSEFQAQAAEDLQVAAAYAQGTYPRASFPMSLLNWSSKWKRVASSRRMSPSIRSCATRPTCTGSTFRPYTSSKLCSPGAGANIRRSRGWISAPHRWLNRLSQCRRPS